MAESESLGCLPHPPGVQDPTLDVRGTERGWGWPGRPQRGDPYIRTWEDSAGGKSSGFESSIYIPEVPSRCSLVCFPVKEGIRKESLGSWRSQLEDGGAGLMASRSRSSLTARILESRGAGPAGLRRAGFGEGHRVGF